MRLELLLQKIFLEAESILSHETNLLHQLQSHIYTFLRSQLLSRILFSPVLFSPFKNNSSEPCNPHLFVTASVNVFLLFERLVLTELLTLANSSKEKQPKFLQTMRKNKLLFCSTCEASLSVHL